MSPYVWIVIAIVALGAELVSLGLVFAGFALAAAVAAALAFAVPMPAQLVAFVVVSGGFLLGVRPLVLPLLPRAREGNEAPRVAPAARFGTVVERVDRLGGQIRIGRGEFWSARSLDPDAVLDPGREVRVTAFDGLTAVVEGITADGASPLPDANRFGLSNRELEVLQLVALGMTNQQIADRLVLSPRTVHHHVEHILDKMGADGRVEAVRLGIAHGLVEANLTTD